MWYTAPEVLAEYSHYDPAVQVKNWKEDLASTSDCSPLGGGPFLFGGNWVMIISGGNRWPADQARPQVVLNGISRTVGGVLVPGVVCGSAFEPPPDLPAGALDSSTFLTAEEADGLRVSVIRRGREEGRVIDISADPPQMLAMWAYRVWRTNRDDWLLALVGDVPFRDYPHTPAGELQAWLINADTIVGRGAVDAFQGVVRSAQRLPLPGDNRWVEAACWLDGDPSLQVLALVGIEDELPDAVNAWHLDTTHERLAEVAPGDVTCASLWDIAALRR